jgi:hypothetical protein
MSWRRFARFMFEDRRAGWDKVRYAVHEYDGEPAQTHFSILNSELQGTRLEIFQIIPIVDIRLCVVSPWLDGF